MHVFSGNGKIVNVCSWGFFTFSVKCSTCFLKNVAGGITAASLMRDYQNAEYCLLIIIVKCGQG